MAEKSGQPVQGPALDVQLWVPADGDLRGIARELATKIAEFLGTTAPNARSLGEAIEKLASRLGNSGSPQGEPISFSFRHVGGELVIEARCAGAPSEIRHPLPS